MAFRIAAIALLASTALARTDLAGCTYYDSVIVPSYDAPYATRVWYVPDSGELCDMLDCGGGRAPPKTTVPGCDAYEGTETYSPSYLDLATISGGSQPTATDAVKTTTQEAAADSTLTTKFVTAAPPTTTSAVASETGSGSSGDEEATTSSVEETTSSTKSAGASTTAAPESSTTSENAAGETPVTTTTQPGAAAMSTAGVLGSCLIAGVAVCVGMF